MRARNPFDSHLSPFDGNVVEWFFGLTEMLVIDCAEEGDTGSSKYKRDYAERLRKSMRPFPVPAG